MLSKIKKSHLFAIIILEALIFGYLYYDINETWHQQLSLSLQWQAEDFENSVEYYEQAPDLLLQSGFIKSKEELKHIEISKPPYTIMNLGGIHTSIAFRNTDTKQSYRLIISVSKSATPDYSYAIIEGESEKALYTW